MAKRRAKKRRRSQRGFSSWSFGKKVAAILGGTLITVVTVCIVIVASKLSKIDTQKLDPKKLNISKTVQQEEEVTQTGYLNVALFGVDSRDNELGKGTRSDTIMVASLNRETKEVKIVSIYRDTLMEQKDGSYNKANAAYSFGGPEEAVAMLNKNLDLNIQHYVTVNFNALIDVIDAVGGVDIDVQEEEVAYIEGYATEILNVTGRQSDGIYGPGPQTLNGVLATAYARIRYTSGDDFRRTERQRAVLEQIVKKAQQSNLSTINKIIDKVFPEISTNFTMTELLMYAKDAMKYKLAETTGFPADNTTDSLSGVGSIVIPKTLVSNVNTLHQFLFGADGYVPSSVLEKINDEIEEKETNGNYHIESDAHDEGPGDNYYSRGNQNTERYSGNTSAPEEDTNRGSTDSNNPSESTLPNQTEQPDDTDSNDGTTGNNKPQESPGSEDEGSSEGTTAGGNDVTQQSY